MTAVSLIETISRGVFSLRSKRTRTESFVPRSYRAHAQIEARVKN